MNNPPTSPTPPEPTPSETDTQPVQQSSPSTPQPPIPPAQPPLSQPPQPVQYGQPQPGGQKSKAHLIIGLVVGGAALLIITIIFIVVVMGAVLNKNSASNTKSSGSSDSSADTGTTDTPQKSALTAKYTSDFSKVCDGTPIANAASYTSPASAKILSFYASPLGSSKTWIYTSAGYGKSYYVDNDTPLEDVSVVTCMTASTRSGSIDCELSNGDVIKYHSSNYKVSFYEAKTGKKIKDGSPIVVEATQCPSLISYDRNKKEAYALPDSKLLEATLDTFVR